MVWKAIRPPGRSTRWLALSTESLARSQHSTSVWMTASKLHARNGRALAAAASLVAGATVTAVEWSQRGLVQLLAKPGTLEAAVDDYLDTCKAVGKEPQRPFRGAFNVRVPRPLHRSAAVRAVVEQTSLNEVVVRALEAYLADRSRPPEP